MLDEPIAVKLMRDLESSTTHVNEGGMSTLLDAGLIPAASTIFGRTVWFGLDLRRSGITGGTPPGVFNVLLDQG